MFITSLPESSYHEKVSACETRDWTISKLETGFKLSEMPDHLIDAATGYRATLAT